MSPFLERFRSIQERIQEASLRRPAAFQLKPLTLVAVSKTHPPETLREALEEGVQILGESRVQEARAKIELLPSKARWHFIGHLQRNKIRQALPLFELFHGVDSLATASDMNRIAEEMGLFPRVLLEVNLAGESSKFGFSPAALRQQLPELLGLGRLQIEGFMTIPPPAPEPEHSRPYFKLLRELRDETEREHRVSLPELSMGMSDDFEVAIEEGSTMVRIGSALFGARSGKTWKPSEIRALDD